MSRSIRPTAAVLAVALAALLAPDGAAQEPATLPARLRALVAGAGLGDRVGVSVVDAVTGREVYTSRAQLPLNPASNMKVLTAAAALIELGADFTMLTGLYGSVEDDAVQDLYLRGFGDPTLRTSDLVELAELLADRGVRRVGNVVVDGRYFDDQMLPPAFEQQPDEISAFRAAISAVAVERSAYALTVIPGEVGAPARVRLACEGYFDVENGITTSESGAPNVVAVQSGSGDTMRLVLRGSVPASILGVSYRRRVENPTAYAGHCMAEALRRSGIRVSGVARVGATPTDASIIVSRRSETLAEILNAMGKWSDNFTAEMVAKVLGAERARPGTTARGLERVEEVLVRAGVPAGSATLVNGSGLFDGNLVAASHVTKLLAHVYQSPAVRDEFLAHLAVGGVEGTLHERLTDVPRGTIRAKTGTLNDVIALSGYAIGENAGRAYAFSVLVNGASGKQGEARALADGIARALAEDLAP